MDGFQSNETNKKKDNIIDLKNDIIIIDKNPKNAGRKKGYNKIQDLEKNAVQSVVKKQNAETMLIMRQGALSLAKIVKDGIKGLKGKVLKSNEVKDLIFAQEKYYNTLKDYDSQTGGHIIGGDVEALKKESAELIQELTITMKKSYKNKVNNENNS